MQRKAVLFGMMKSYFDCSELEQTAEDRETLFLVVCSSLAAEVACVCVCVWVYVYARVRV
jgi:hypothetical protein